MALDPLTQKPIRRGAYPELTVPAVLVGYILGILLAVAIGYAALILGFSIEGSELAAILGFAILRGVMGRASIIENNINQTIASAVNGASSGMMFSVPALFILGYDDFNRAFMVLGCVAGAVMGICFVIPLRKQMIDFNRLAFPGGIAVATILKSPGAGIQKAYLLLGAALVSAVAQFFVQFYEVETFNLGLQLGLPEFMNGIWYLSLLTVGVGFLSGKGGIYFIIGGYVCYWILAPIMNAAGILPSPAELEGSSITGFLRLSLYRPLGIGMLIGGALTGIALAFPLIVSAVRSMQSAAKAGTQHAEDEMPIKLMYFAIAGAFMLLFLMSIFSTEHMTLWRAGAMALLGTLWVWVAGVVLSECIGRTNWSPLSGMTLIGITILIFVASGLPDREAVIASVMVGAAMCVAMSQATDLMLDMKTGYMVGSQPRKQQIAQLLGTWLGPIVVMTVIIILHKSSGLGSDKLPAPQGQALASVISGILGGDVPVDKYASGAFLGALLSASGIGGLGVLVGLGFYLPFHIVLTYTIGTISRILVDKFKGAKFSHNVGIPIAAGLIVGEALVAVGAAIIKVLEGM
ncbi:MAG: OPT/YSL family transporter [Acidobacteria bacterium]|nr:OPT/YSL family transporter [Acidobacteriota bacterium]